MANTRDGAYKATLKKYQKSGIEEEYKRTFNDAGYDAMSMENKITVLKQFAVATGLKMKRAPYRKRDKPTAIYTSATLTPVSRQLSLAEAFIALMKAIDNEADKLSDTVIEAYNEQIENLKQTMAAAKKKALQRSYEAKKRELERLQIELAEFEKRLK